MTSKIFKTVVPFLGAAMLVQATEWAGEISASDVTVQVGEVPTIQWSVTYPVGAVDDVIDIDDGEITPKRCLTMDVRLLGASWGNAYRFDYVYGSLQVSGDTSQLFYGHHEQIDPTEVLFSELVEPGMTIRASAKGWNSNKSYRRSNKGYWTSTYNSWDNTPNVVLLKNGDDAPQLTPTYAIQKDVKGHLSPYMDMTTGKMVLGPRDVVYLFDFNQAGSSGYDLQDFCVLITFTDAACGDAEVIVSDSTNGNGHGNNGHGNNADGIDVSNPGQGGGGPNGEQDTDYDGDGTYEDDENKSGW